MESSKKSDHIETFIFIICKSSLVICLFLTSQASNQYLQKGQPECEIVKVCKTFSRFLELLPSLFICRPSVDISHFNLLLRNHWANCNQTLVEWSLDGPLPNVYLVIPIFNQDGCQAKNRKRGGGEILIVHCCFSISQNELKF